MSVVETRVAIDPELPDHAFAPLAELPAGEVMASSLDITDLTFGLGEVVPGHNAADRKSGR